MKQKRSDRKSLQNLGFGCLFMIGIVVLMVFPSFDVKVRKSSQAGTRSVLKHLIKNQHQYFREYQRFTPNLELLYKGTSTGLYYYNYQMSIDSEKVLLEAIPQYFRLKSYSAALFIAQLKNSTLFIGGVCESHDFTTIPPTPIQPPSLDSAQIQCPPNSELIRTMEFQKSKGEICIRHSPDRSSPITTPNPKQIRCPAGFELRESMQFSD